MDQSTTPPRASGPIRWSGVELALSGILLVVVAALHPNIFQTGFVHAACTAVPGRPCTCSRSPPRCCRCSAWPGCTRHRPARETRRRGGVHRRPRHHGHRLRRLPGGRPTDPGSTPPSAAHPIEVALGRPDHRRVHPNRGHPSPRLTSSAPTRRPEDPGDHADRRDRRPPTMPESTPHRSRTIKAVGQAPPTVRSLLL
jgi:hypothetical protein